MKENILKNLQPTMNDSDVLTLGLLAIDVFPDDNHKCLEVIEEYLKRYGNELNLLVLPELFNSGFISDKGRLDEYCAETRTVLKSLKSLAQKYQLSVAGSAFWKKETDIYYNRGFIIKPTGEISYYDKRHLFCKSPESKLMQRGNRLPDIVNINGWNIRLIICYDLRFPVWCRQSRDEESRYDLLLVVANWPDVREYTWTHLLIARAIENQAFVAGVNRTGEDQYGTYDSEMTIVFDPLGQPVKGICEGDFIKVRISKSEIERQRAHWPLSNDADDFSIDLTV